MVESNCNYFVYRIGNNYDGCLLNGTTTDITKIELLENDEISQAMNRNEFFIGVRNCFYVTNDILKYYGRDLVDPHEEKIISNYESLISFSFEFKVRSISAGLHHCLLLNENGEVFSIGKSIKGELGLGPFVDFIDKFTKIELKARITKIFANTKQSYAICEEGRVYCWGSNRNNELGLSESNDENHIPVLLNFPKVSNAEPIAFDIQLGLRFTLFITYLENQKTYFASGDNKKSVFLGEEIKILKLKEFKIKEALEKSLLNCSEIINAQAGWNNIYFHIINNEKSTIVCCGDNNLNQLASNDKTKRINCIEHEKLITKLYVGTEFSYFVDIQQEIYSFGWNEHYNLCSGDNNRIERVTKISVPEALNNSELKGIYLGGAFAYLMFKD